MKINVNIILFIEEKRPNCPNVRVFQLLHDLFLQALPCMHAVYVKVCFYISLKSSYNKNMCRGKKFKLKINSDCFGINRERFKNKQLTSYFKLKKHT